MRYTFRQLEIFVEAARDCNFARAADRLGISQPAVSDHIRTLERNLGLELFLRRRGTTSRLTAAGQRLREEAGAVLDQGARLSDRAVSAKQMVSLRVFAGPYIFERMLRPALPGFHRDHPDIALNIFSEFPTESLGGMIERNELDIAVFSATAAHIPPEALVICEAPCVVVASTALAGEGDLTAADIGRLPFVLPLEGSPAARWVERALGGLGITPERIVSRTQFLDVQQKMVESGQAAALLFEEDVEASSVRRQLRRLSPPTLGPQRALLMRRGEQRPEAHAVAAFLTRVVGPARRPAAA